MKAYLESLPVKEEVSVDRNKDYKIASVYVKGWSNWTKNDYLGVNDEIKKICGSMPMAWKTENWISRVKERKE